ncbi:IS66 family insertion sequence element accessory protein TnpB [Pseudomonas chlororaphis]|uniref:IS66 family insertion sequence element accessory protein TnpB n=1 Tax=Pseudomonas chlororaphis TaxID=587753 RepID=UPI0009BFFB42|nr:IS66 family insertion sequence element accessory protein TnpB [Pseudomonas chlororaphis]
MIRIDAIGLATEPMDMRAGTETAMARVVAMFGAAQPHCAYLFANCRANRMKVLVHDGLGIWLAARRLHQGKLFWPGLDTALRWNWAPNNCMPWCWVCHGKESGLAARFPSFNACHDHPGRAIVL